MEIQVRSAINGLLGRLRGGDRSAGPELFRLLWPVLHKFCARLLSDSTSAEDAAQRAITRVFEQASRFDPERDGLAWALEIAVWECRTERRRRSRSREVAWNPASAEGAEERASPADQLAQAELVAALEAAVANLSPLDRETIQLLLRDATAEVPAATWRKRKERALHNLKLTWRTLYGNE
jgi:RNA polymerase sigma-70 factor (ECF subfamily)